ncbi:hypothetical protein A5634_15325 [Mycobacterium asiaticum]|uniref:HTH tetR-type domain-containing protein n=1 Tax=Mycobacterium asiaticum TaxID=1790 RepID=A0A1A3PDI6_MYCAS|nr:TetR/AcrR family transcriptional regulator [Mycobacterium asiaticum]OBK30662.1 hypothetical protein A5634_15325 [Mycobacterium asiaticum]
MTQVAQQRRGGRTTKLGRPPGSSGEETVARLVEAALINFGDKGYAGARMTEIAAAAGISHSSIYQYFTSKQELYGAVFDAAQSELLPEYLAAMAEAKTFKAQIGAIFRASARVHERRPAITPFLASMPVELRRHPALLPSLQAEGSPMVGALQEMFGDARRRGEIASTIKDDDMMIAFIGSAMGVGLLSHGMSNGRMSAAVDILLDAFGGRFFNNSVED